MRYLHPDIIMTIVCVIVIIISWTFVRHCDVPDRQYTIHTWIGIIVAAIGILLIAFILYW